MGISRRYVHNALGVHGTLYCTCPLSVRNKEHKDQRISQSPIDSTMHLVPSTYIFNAQCMRMRVMVVFLSVSNCYQSTGCYSFLNIPAGFSLYSKGFQLMGFFEMVMVMVM